MGKELAAAGKEVIILVEALIGPDFAGFRVIEVGVVVVFYQGLRAG